MKILHGTDDIEPVSSTEAGPRAALGGLGLCFRDLAQEFPSVRGSGADDALRVGGAAGGLTDV